MFSSNEETILKFSVHDSAQNQVTQSFIKVGLNKSVDDIYKDISERSGYQPDEIDISLKSDDTEIVSTVICYEIMNALFC